ncbi:transmembrane protein 69 isoform X3 [Nilaparvata lugens]|nr:transmembrane protein 69 isoform X3 [Nilaparvata lugens]
MSQTAFVSPRLHSATHLLPASHHTCFKRDTCVVKQNKQRSLHTANTSLKQKLDLLTLVQTARSNVGAVQMRDIKNAPLPVFWCGVAGLIPYMAPVVVQVFTGYMPLLGTAQLMYSGTILSFLGGLKFGSMIHCDKADCSWANIGLATVPAVWAWSGLLLPVGFALPVVGSGLLASLVIDLATSKYPPWFVALKCALTLTATLCVLLCLKQFIFNNPHYYEAVDAD